MLVIHNNIFHQCPPIPSIPLIHHMMVTQGYNVQRGYEHREWGEGKSIEEGGARDGGVMLL